MPRSLTSDIAADLDTRGLATGGRFVRGLNGRIVVGSALVEVLGNGQDVAAFLRGLRE